MIPEIELEHAAVLNKNKIYKIYVVMFVQKGKINTCLIKHVRTKSSKIIAYFQLL
jgi:hypothetical protein